MSFTCPWTGFGLVANVYRDFAKYFGSRGDREGAPEPKPGEAEPETGGASGPLGGGIGPAPTAFRR